MSTKPSFSERRLRMSAAADDAEGIARDLRNYADILAQSARFFELEAKAMERAEARYQERTEHKKAAPEGRPLSTT